MMKNLKQRLREDILQNLEDNKDKYPASYKSLMEKLENNYSINDLNFGSITSLAAYSTTYVSSILDIYGMFEDLKIEIK